MKKSEQVKVAASVMGIAFYTEYYTRRYGPIAVLKVRKRIYGGKLEAADAEYGKVSKELTMDAELRWETSAVEVAKRHIEENSNPGVPDEAKAQYLTQIRTHYIMYRVSSATQALYREVIALQAKSSSLKPEVVTTQMGAMQDARLNQMRQMLQTVFSEDHLIVDPHPAH